MTAVLMFFIVDFGIYFTFKDSLDKEEKQEEVLNVVELIQHKAKKEMTPEEANQLKNLDLSEVSEPCTEGFHAEGAIIGRFADEPIYETIRDTRNNDLFHYAGVIIHHDVNDVIQKMMINNQFEKVVRFENGLIYAIKKEL